MSKQSKKKKEPKREVNPKYRETRFSIDPALTGHRVYSRSPLDDELESEDAMMARELKEMRVDEMNQKRRLRVAKLQKEIDKLEKETEKTESNDSDIPRISIAMAQQIANLPPADRDKVVETYAMFRGIDQSKGRGDALLPLLIGYSKTNTGSSQSDMATYAKAMSDQFKTGIDVMKSVIPKEKPSNATEVLKLFKELVTDSIKTPMAEMVKNLQPQPSAFEQIIMNPEMRSAAKEMGMFGSQAPKTGSTNTDLEIEKLRRESTLEIKKLDLDWRKSLLESEAKITRDQNIIAALGPLSAFVAGPASQRMRQFGQQQATAHPPMNMPPPSNNIMIKCSCGYQGPVSFQGPPPERVNCPICGLELVVREPPDDRGKPD